jgi:hypothetical protein
MTTNLPTKRYDIFISAFEKVVERKQKEIERVNALQKAYEIARTALERLELKNDTVLELHERGIDISISPLPTDKKGFYDAMLKEIGQELKAFNLHPTGLPVATTTSFDFVHEWKLRISNLFVFPPHLRILLDVPIGGTETIKIWEGPKQQSVTYYSERKPYWKEDGEPETIDAAKVIDNEI